MLLSKQSDLSRIKSDLYIDVTQTIQWLGFKSEELVYITTFVWEKFIHWTVGDDHFFNVRQTEHQRQDNILKDVIRRLEVSGEQKKAPDMELYFYQNIIVRGVHNANGELALFKLSNAINEHNACCLIIDAVSIKPAFSKKPSKIVLWEYQLLNDMVENVLCADDALSENLELLDDLLQRDDESLHGWLTINDEQGYSFMLASARKVFTALQVYFNEQDDYTDAEQILLNVREQLFK